MTVSFCAKQLLLVAVNSGIRKKFLFLFILIALAFQVKVYSQTTNRTFTAIPVTDPDLNAPGRGVEQWHDRNDVNVPVEGTNTQRLDVYYRFVWTKIEGPTLGSYTWTYFDGLVNAAILKRQKFSFGIMTVYPGGNTTDNGLVAYDGANSSYPLYLHTLMQSESIKDWKTGSIWTPNYNSEHYLNRLLALNQAINAHIEATSFNGVRYRDVINCIDIRGYGGWGEWHSAYTVNNVISDYPAGTFPTVASLKRIVDAHTQAFPNFPLVAMIAAFDAQWLQNTWNPPEIAYYILTTRNTWGPIGWRRDQWGALDQYLKDYLENNNRSFGTSGPFKNYIMERWRTSPITGEPPAWNPDGYSDLERQIRLYHAASFGNGNYGVTPTTTIKTRVRAASKACGYRLVVENATVTVADRNVSILMNWKNLGLAPTYENWNVQFELRTVGNALVWSGLSQFNPKLFLPSTTATPVTDNFSLPANIPGGTYTLNFIIKDPNNYRGPLPLAITGRNADSSYTITPITLSSALPAPTVTVVDNCGSSVLTAGSFTGSLLWSTGETTSSITVANPGTYTVTQTLSGSTSLPGSGVAAPKVTPAPTVTVANNCGNSVLTAGSYTGSILWSNGATTPSITVSAAGTYTVTQTFNGCTSIPGSGTAAPINPVVATPIVTVTDDCGSSLLSASNFIGPLLWSNGAVSPSITVTSAGTYTVIQSVNGCSSAPGTGTAAPKPIPAPPTVIVVDNCESSLLTAGSVTGSLLWNNGATTESISVLTAGTYTVTQAVDGCTSAAGSGISAPKTSPLAPTVSVTNNCGNSVLTASDFTGSLLWSTGETTAAITVTAAGTYTVTQMVNGCSSIAGSGIATPLNSDVATPTVAVIDDCGSSLLTASGFTGSLLWSNGSNSPSITVSTAGEYTVTQSVDGCSSSPASGIAAPKIIPAAPTVAVVNNCESSVLTASNFTGSLLWSNGATSSSVTVTTAGTYSITQTADGCLSAASSGSANPKTTPVAPTVTVADNCGNSVLTASGFTGSLLWSTGQTTASITVTTAGTYTVTQTSEGCTSVAGSGVAAPKIIPAAPTVSVVNYCENSLLIAADVTGTLLWSTGETTASITVTTSGTFTVTQTEDGCTSAVSNAFTNPKTSPAAPTVTVANNCGNSVLTASGFTGSLEWSTGETTSSITVTIAGTYTVTQVVGECISAAGSGTAAPINSNVATPTVTATDNCGSSILTASDFTGSLLWSNGATSSSITVSTPGSYTVTQSVNGCSSSPATGVAVPKEIPSAPTVNVVNNCENSLLIAADVTGTLLWSTGETTASINVTNGGAYTVTQTVNGCASTSGSGTAVPKTNPPAPTVTVVNNCGNSLLTASGFTGSLLWSTGETTPSITVSIAGTYTVTQTIDECTSAEGSGTAAPVNSNVATPTVTVTDNCGSSVLTASNFTGSLLWSNGATSTSITVSTPGTYTVTQSVNGCSSSPASGVAAPKAFPAAPTVSVVNNCESSILTASDFTGSLLWSTSETTASITVTTAGTFAVTQTVDGCTSAEGNASTNPKTNPTAPTVTVANNCGNSVLTASGFTGSLLWSTGETTASITVTTSGTYTVTQTVDECTSAEGSGTAAPINSNVATPIVTVTDNCGSSVLTASDFTGSLLWSNGSTSTSITVSAPGTYTVTQSVNGCSSSPASGVAAPKAFPAAPTVDVVNNCESSILTASDFTGSLLWSTNETTASITVTTAGTFAVTQTVDGCTSAQGSATTNPKTNPTAPIVTVANNCGNSVLTANGFTGSLLWNTGETTASITVSISGTYTVTQTIDECTSAEGSGTASPINSVVATPTVTVINNCGNSILTASDFTGSLLWSNGATSSSITVTNAGTYTVTQSINGCSSSPASGVAAPKAFPAAPTVDVVNNCESSILTASDFTGSLLWSTNETTASITVTTAGTYAVTQTVDGCTSAQGNASTNPKTNPTAPTVTVANNCGNSVLTANGFTGSLLWSNGATSTSITIAVAGTYTVTQTVDGCTSEPGSGTASPINSVVATPTVTVTNNCGNSILTASDFTGSLLWSNGATSTSITVSTPGTYTVTQSVNGCTSSPATGVAAPKAFPAAPTVDVVNNCESSILTASDFTGSLLWSTNETTASITVTTAGTFAVTQTVDGCTSAQGSATTNPKTNPTAPTVTVANNCGNSVLTANGFTGSLLWNTGETTASITVSISGTYTVTQTIDECTSAEGSGTASPINSVVATPTVTVINNCGNSILTASDFTGSLLWSNGATSSSITVTNAGTYTVTQSINGCSSSPATGVAAPKTIPAAPTVEVVNNCESSVLTASDFSGSLLWSNGATSSSVTVATAGTYSVTQTVDGCTSSEGSGTTAPKTTPLPPTITAADNCGNTILTASGFNGSLAWSTGETTPSITVTTAGTYTVAQTVDGCTSTGGSGMAAPKIIPSPPTISVVDNCENSVLTASDVTGSLLWSNGSAAASITVTGAGNYSVSQSENGCTSSAASGVAAPKGIPTAPTISVVDNCESSVLTASNITGSLLWSTGESSASITVPDAGLYTVTQTVNGCTSEESNATTDPKTTPLAPTVTVANNCGSSVLTASGFTGSLLWSTGETSASITVTAAGNYTVTQTVSGCTSSAGNGNAAPINSAVAIPTVTVTNNCGNAVLTASDFTGSLLWSNGSTSSSITVSTPGTYTVTQFVNGCSSSPATGIAAPKAFPAAPTVNVVNNCENSLLTASDITGSLLWNTGESTASITVTSPGTYTVTQSVNGCTSLEGSGTSAPKTTPLPPVVSTTNNCGNSLLTASVVTGSLLWSTGETTASITVTTAGTYTVTQSVNGCTSSSANAIAAPKANPDPPTVEVVNNCESSELTASGFSGSLLWSNGATSSSITVTDPGLYTVTQSIDGCTSTAGGNIAAPKTTPAAPSVAVNNNCGNSVLTASGFTGSLLWSTGETTASITVTTGGNYTVTQHVNGCTSTAGSGVAEPISSAVATPTVTVTDNCGSSLLTASNFTGSLLWSNGATSSSITVSTPGTYNVTQSINGCSSSPGSGVASPKTIPAAPTVTVADNCGSSLLTASDFEGSLLWSNGATSSSITVSSAGTYTITQTFNGCISEATSGTAAPNNSPIAPTVSVTNNCGNSVLTASGFTGSLLWSTGETTSSITVLTAGTYTVTQVVNGCTSPEGDGTAAPINNAVATPVVTVTDNCGNSVLTASAFTGSLLWSNGSTNSSITTTTPGTYTVTQSVNGCSSSPGAGIATPKPIPAAPAVSIVNNCESSVLTASDFNGSLLWSNGANSSSITVTNADLYSVTQTVSGCTSEQGTGSAAPKPTPGAPSVSVINNCGNSVLTASGITGSLLWSNGATTTSITVTTPGTYTVTQTVSGCTSLPGSGVAAPLNSSVTTPTIAISNNCGNAVLTASGFTGSLLWSNGATTPSITVTTAGTYTVTQTVDGCTSSPASGVAAPTTIPTAPAVTVVNNCGNSVLTAESFTGSLLWSNGATSSSITVTNAATYTVTQTVTGCTSAAGNGTAAPIATPSAPTVTVANNCGNSVLTASGFTGSLLWSNGSTNSSITVTVAGTYTVTQSVTGCTSLPASGVAAPLNSSVTTPTVTVINNCGSSVLTAGSFTGSLLWSNGATTSSITVATAGTYTVTQTINGCTSTPASGVAAPTTIPSAPTVTVVNNCGNSVLTAGSFTGSLLWSNGGTTNSITVTTSGTYTVTQTVNGCTSTTRSAVAAPNPTPAAPTITVVNNCGNSVLTAGSFTGSLLWSNGATTSSITVTTAGTYTVRQTVNGCTSATRSGVAAPRTIPAAPTVSVVNNCGNSVLTASTFTGTLLWSNGATTSSITVTTAGTYTVTQTVNGCTSVARSAVAAPGIIPSLSSSLTATATSGTAFTYTATSATTGTTFAWTRAAVTGISNAAGSGTGNINETLVNTTSSTINVTYIYTLTNSGCSRTQNVVVAVNPASTVNCVINGGITTNFNSTSIPAGRYIWFNSSFNPGSIGNGTATVTFNVTNSRITFTANSQQYTLNVPNSRIRFISTVTSASTQFVNNVWETTVPRNYSNYIFMGGLAYLVPANLPGNISNVRWTADIVIDRTNTSLAWRWSAATYTSFAAHAGLNIKPIDANNQNPYRNSNNAGTPENFKSSLVAGAKGNGGSNYTGTYSSTSNATCTVNVGQRSSAQPVTDQQSYSKQVPGLSIVHDSPEKLEANVMPNPSNTFFNLSVRSSHNFPVRIRITNIFGQVVERHEKIASNVILQLGHKLASGSYFVEVVQGDERRVIKIIKAN